MEDLLPCVDTRDLDLVLVEGFKREPIPRIELYRPSLGRPMIHAGDPQVVAVAADTPFPLARDLPLLDLGGVPVRLLPGTGWGMAWPVDVTSPLVYALATVSAGRSLALPDHEERGVYSVSGSFSLDGTVAEPHTMLVADRGPARLTAVTDTTVAVLGGDAIGPRHMWWNLIHSDPERLRAQAARYREGGFPVLAADPDDLIPAPPGP